MTLMWSHWMEKKMKLDSGTMGPNIWDVPDTSDVRLGSGLGSATVSSSHGSVVLIMVALFGRLSSLRRFSLQLQLHLQTEQAPKWAAALKSSSQGQTEMTSSTLLPVCTSHFLMMTHLHKAEALHINLVHSFSVRPVSRSNRSDTLFRGQNEWSHPAASFLSRTAAEPLSCLWLSLWKKWNITVWWMAALSAHS